MWNGIFSVRTLDKFLQELPPDLLEGFSCTLRDEDAASVNIPRKQTFQGVKRAPILCSAADGLSFVNLAAYCGQREYVVQQTTKSPELLRSRGEFHILLSAALGNKKDLVRDLLERGSSPLDCVNCQLSETTADEATEENLGIQSIPLWIIFTTLLVGYRFEIPGGKVQWEVLELLLQDHRVDASNSLFLVREDYKTPATHFITLRQFINDRRPQNADRLLALLERDNGNSYVNSARRFLSTFTTLFKQTDSVVDKKTQGSVIACTLVNASDDHGPTNMITVTCGAPAGSGIAPNSVANVTGP